jgi:hypothetical protein
MTSVVISQPMFFPWVGMFEQIKLADIYVHYVDVQFSKGSFVNRVQIKTSTGIKWLTVPLKGLTLGQHISDVEINDSKDWRGSHYQMLTQAYADSPFRDDMLAVVEKIYGAKVKNIGEIAINSLNAVVEYFDLNENTRFVDSRDMKISGASSQRVLDIVGAVGGDIYISGHGAKKYLDHKVFERKEIRVEYMDYQMAAYPQLHGEFTPYVSILDLIANCGKEGRKCINSGASYWRESV